MAYTVWAEENLPYKDIFPISGYPFSQGINTAAVRSYNWYARNLLFT